MTDPLVRLSQALPDRYRIERELGAGGMATVYLAEDIRHHRKVAVKVLKPELAAVVGAERFLAEIETTAKLQHPNILPLFDSGTADSFLFYVMPYVEGESLRERLDREHQLPIEEAVQIARSLGEALDHAHRRGVIHRDIKPANVMLLDGKPVLSDFGIALAVGAAGGGRLTETGLSLGTPHYMSPEQATGDAHVGPSADIYALGCVLYEMLVGETPFSGPTPQAVLGRIIAGDFVAPIKRRSNVPPNVDAAIRQALEPLPADRFATALDFARALATPEFRHGSEDANERTPRRRTVGYVAAALVIGVALGALAYRSLLHAEPAPRTTFQIALGNMVYGGTGGGVSMDWSPDGSRLVFAAFVGAPPSRLWMRSMDQLEPAFIRGSEGAGNPAFSPDGASIAFTTAEGSLKTVIPGEEPITIVREGVPNAGTGVDWADDGMLYYSSGRALHRVPATGGTPEALTTPDSVSSHIWLNVLPGSRGLIFTIAQGNDPSKSVIAVLPRNGNEPRVLFPGVMARYARSGHLIYATVDGTVFAAPFDVRRLEVTGPPVSLVQGVRVAAGSAAQFAFSQLGTLSYWRPSPLTSEIVRVTRTGGATAIEPGWVGAFGPFSLSPDGTRLAVGIGPAESSGSTGFITGSTAQDVWIKDLQSGTLSKVTFEGSINYRPQWNPDGRTLLIHSNRRDTGGCLTGACVNTDLWTASADGTGSQRLLLDLHPTIPQAEWSRSGDWMVIRTGGSADDMEILAWRPGVDAAPRPLISTPFQDRSPTLSPNGRLLAYVSDQSKKDEIYLRPFPNVNDGLWLVSRGGGTEPVWARSGRELFYRNGAGEMVAVRVDDSKSAPVGESTVLFDARPFAAEALNRFYDVTADDRYFIMARPAGVIGSGQMLTIEENLLGPREISAP